MHALHVRVCPHQARACREFSPSARLLNIVAAHPPELRGLSTVVSAHEWPMPRVAPFSVGKQATLSIDHADAPEAEPYSGLHGESMSSGALVDAAPDAGPRRGACPGKQDAERVLGIDVLDTLPFHLKPPGSAEWARRGRAFTPAHLSGIESRCMIARRLRKKPDRREARSLSFLPGAASKNSLRGKTRTSSADVGCKHQRAVASGVNRLSVMHSLDPRVAIAVSRLPSAVSIMRFEGVATSVSGRALLSHAPPPIDSSVAAVAADEAEGKAATVPNLGTPSTEVSGLLLWLPRGTNSRASPDAMRYTESVE
eukprot:CAMPEP_0183375504 /NCGR_PEP_ID=MMETSP0164_2-20130417/117578_1 /TAXON_ID=221442 /ORGANISM="Coccolithus pelagicus ssp braarudi, Strain PLY182g" /LENGTH=311 /DNA_ID=CAMNT_0025552675 /DNA_START=581 /DNA_END=1517 /DNA_ORIENTATION=-